MLRIRKNTEFFDQVNITNLIDVLFVLLAIIMISSYSVAHTGVSIQIPGVQKIEKAAPSSLEIIINREGNIFLDNNSLEIEELKERLQKVPKDRKSPRVLVKADGRVHYGRITQVLDTVRSAGLESVSLAVESKK